MRVYPLMLNPAEVGFLSGVLATLRSRNTVEAGLGDWASVQVARKLAELGEHILKEEKERP